MHSVVIRERITLPGPRGRLTGELAYPEQQARGSVLIANPHPFMGGRLDNNVVAHLAEVLPERGFITLRFDYGGVGESEDAAPAPDVAASMLAFWETGRAPEDPVLVEEVRAARTWLQLEFDTSLAMVGYSFGCHAVSQSLDESPAAAVALIAPTVKQHDLAAVARSCVPKLLLYSNNDFATGELATETWYGSLQSPKERHCFVGADHFFKGSEEVAGRLVGDFLVRHMPAMAGEAGP